MGIGRRVVSVRDLATIEEVSVRDRARSLAALAVGIGLFGAGVGLGGPASAATTPAAKPTVAPLHGLLQADMMVVASTSFPSRPLGRIPQPSGGAAVPP